MIKHHPTCRSDYPEKPENEAPQSTTDIDIGDGEIARNCNDCGAFELLPAQIAQIRDGEIMSPADEVLFRKVHEIIDTVNKMNR